MPRANPTVAHLKVVIDHPNIRRLGVGQAMLKNLNQQLVQLAEGLHPPIVNLHELFDCQSITVIHTPQRCEFFLMIKQDPVICSPGHDVQCEAHLTQKLLAVAKLLTLVFAEEIRLPRGSQTGTKAPQRNPFNHLQVAKSPG